MSCRKEWNDDFLDLNFTKSFRTGNYKKHREDILIERELSILPTRQHRVEATLQMREHSAALKAMCDELSALEVARKKIFIRYNHERSQVIRYAAEAEGRDPPAWTVNQGDKQERAKFIMKCPAEECRGFLSTAYKCGTCQLWACPDCLVIKGPEKDVEHTCDPGQKESVALIIKESKGCPKCGQRISKIDGCFSGSTPILLWDGSIQEARFIQVGDELVGDDGTKRTVQSLCSGEDMMYEITQSRGVTYTVNSKHTLCLKSNKGIHTDIIVDDYMKLSTCMKNKLYGIKGNGIDWPAKSVHLEPYMMGAWLGDGINNGTDFACCPSKDPELIHYLLDWCERNNSELVHDDIYRFRIRKASILNTRKAIGKGSSSSTCKGCQKAKCNLCDLPIMENSKQNTIKSTKNKLKDSLEKYNLIRNKHIPIDYIVNDRQSRLQLLAGFIDTDGYVSTNGKRIQIPQSNHKIAKQLEFLALSLGFIVSIDILKKKNISFNGGNSKDYSDQMRISISGENLSEIPTLLPRKRCVNSTPNKDWRKSSITVTEVGRGTYYGWTLDNNHKFLLPDTTIVKNCDQMWCTDCHTAFSWSTGQIVNGVVHNPHYYEFLRQAGNGVAPRNIGDVPCGGIPPYNRIFRLIKDSEHSKAILSFHRITAEIQDQRIVQYQGRFRVEDNGDLGVKYLMKEISKEDMKAELVKRETKRLKHNAIRAVLEMFVTTSTILLNALVDGESTLSERMQICVESFMTLRTYVNDALMNISRMKQCSVPQITGTWQWSSFNKVTPKPKVKKAAAPA